jgi:hypothetical protein
MQQFIKQPREQFWIAFDASLELEALPIITNLIGGVAEAQNLLDGSDASSEVLGSPVEIVGSQGQVFIKSGQPSGAHYKISCVLTCDDEKSTKLEFEVVMLVKEL